MTMDGKSYDKMHSNESMGYQFIPKSFIAEEFESLEELLEDPVSHLFDSIYLLSFSAKHRDEDNPLYHEAMQGPHREGYRDVMRQEIEQLESQHTWKVVPCPKTGKVIPGTWVFRAKRYPHGALCKLKARFCV